MITLTRTEILQIRGLLRSSAEIAEDIARSDLKVLEKSDGSPVTNADIEISKYILQHLQTITPNIPIISEEEESPDDFGNNFWLVDPIDGTKSYINGVPLYTINLGLIVEGIPKYGFVINPSTGHLYSTSESCELEITCNGESIEIQKNSGPLKALLSTYDGKKATELLERHNIKLYEVIPGALKFCLLAAGHADLYPRFGETMEWDTAAGHALIKASGGEIFDLNGKVLQYGKPDLLNEGFVAYSQRLIVEGNI
jgi:3'(2'), 5'-bisphosphate nucleotidase